MPATRRPSTGSRLRTGAYQFSVLALLAALTFLIPSFLSGRVIRLTSSGNGEDAFLERRSYQRFWTRPSASRKVAVKSIDDLFPKELVAQVQQASLGGDTSRDGEQQREGLEQQGGQNVFSIASSNAQEGLSGGAESGAQAAGAQGGGGATTSAAAGGVGALEGGTGMEEQAASTGDEAATNTSTSARADANSATNTTGTTAATTTSTESAETSSEDDGRAATTSFQQAEEEALRKPIDTQDPAWIARKKRATQLATGGEESEDVVLALEAQSVAQAAHNRLGPPLGIALALHKNSLWKREEISAGGSDQYLLNLIRDQLIMARAYMALAQQHDQDRLAKELKLKVKESMKAVGEATMDSELHPSAKERMRAMGQLLAKARDQLYDCPNMVKKLRAMVQAAEEQARLLKKQGAYLSQLAAKTLPKGLTCLALRLTIDFYALPPVEREFPGKFRLTDNRYYHYALFSDNVLAAAVVVNSTVVNAEDSSLHVFHIVTDSLNLGAMKMWFLLNPPRRATIEVASVDDFKWLNSSYCPVLHQLESASMKEYYFKSGKQTGTASDGQLLKYRNPKYLSMLNHLRFYLPEVFPALDKILFVDDDVVVQRDLTGLWKVDLHSNVNGAVETCGESFHRYDKYLNFSNPLIADNFDPWACGWAYGMNVFDLKEWKRRNMTGVYHYWQSLNDDRQLWKLGTLPPGLITFYNTTQPLDKTWHALGMGYNPNLDMNELERAAVVHYNGNMKPWLEIAMPKFRPFWTKYVMFDHPFLQQCNINE
eukprot:TRINITY_DN488_c0_g1_i1.p1 TRINITY_DN488_c0_g1~~TRINITY_DN488_c0_g1_i1.p1  ORF type:complete len:771 (+),score=188.96 TRINITY_DN488_c0_g1_i1:562-2874(+)